MTHFSAHDQLVATMMNYTDSTLWELAEVAGEDSDRWKIGLKDIDKWPDAVIAEEKERLLEIEPSTGDLLTELVETPPPISAFLISYISEVAKNQSIISKEYMSRFGPQERFDTHKFILTRVCTKMRMRVKLPPDLYKFPSVTSKRSSRSQRSQRVPTCELSPNDSVSCSGVPEPPPPKSNVSKRREMAQSQEVREMSIVSKRDELPALEEDAPYQTTSQTMSFDDLRSGSSKIKPNPQATSKVSSKFPSQFTTSSEVSLMR